MKEKYIVKIAGAELKILSDESEDYLNSLVRILDRRIGDMVMTNKRCTRLEAAVLCALDYLDDKIKAAAEIESLKQQIEELRGKLEK